MKEILETVCLLNLSLHYDQLFSRVQLFVIPWIIAPNGSLSMEFSREEYWSGLPFPPLGDLPNPGIEPASLASPILAHRFFNKVRKICSFIQQVLIKDLLCVWPCVQPLGMQRYIRHFCLQGFIVLLDEIGKL